MSVIEPGIAAHASVPGNEVPGNEAQGNEAVGRAALRKASWRLIPLIAVGYGIAYMDRVNISFAALQMNRDLHFSASVYGFGAGLFFVSYALCEVPSNLLLYRVGARRWFARIMLTWGLLAMGMMFVKTPLQFYVMRFLLGMAEAGFFPGVIFYLAQWFPPHMRARAISRFYISLPISSVLIGLVAGWLLGLQGKAGLAGWQWLFLVEGMPAVVLSLVFLLYLPTGPADAKWLTHEERQWILFHVRQGEAVATHTGSVARALLDRRVGQVSLVFLCMLTCSYAYTFSAPAILQGITSFSNRNVGFLVSAMNLLGAPCMLLNAMHSDRTRERYFHVIIPFCLVAACYVIGGLSTAPYLAVPALAIASLSYYALQGPLLALASSLLGGKSGAAGIAAMNTIGILGGFIGPNWMGRAKDLTGAYQLGLLALVIPSLLGAATLFLMRSRMKRSLGKAAVLVAVAVCAVCCRAQNATTQASHVTIVRDDWGIAHVYGGTDADAVFGMIYAQCEDDFNRVETNYLNAMGRLAETEGEGKVYQDLRMKLFIDPEDLKKQYAASPVSLKKLMDAFADGANFYLAKHPEVKPHVIQHFEPWMALSFTEGSIGGDIERVDLAKLEAFYGDRKAAALLPEQAEVEPGGSNGIAIAPSNTVQHHAMLLINPHTSFFFRSELQMVSGEGLNAYGAVTWGQFFIYQGFNQRVGWMHTSSGVDAVDEYLETVHSKHGHSYYKYGKGERPMVEKQIIVPYKTTHGMAEKKFTVYSTQHGPVIREQYGKWVTIRLMQKPVNALMESYLRTKANNYQQYLKTMELKANSSNNTIYADADGHIAYFHGNFIPRRDSRFDFTQPVDGSNPATEWQGLLTVAEAPHLLDPASGYLFNVNDSPWNGAGESSLRKQDYPVYVETGTESARGVHAIRLLQGKKDFTLDSLVAAAYDSYLPWFSKLLPRLFDAWASLPATSATRDALAGQIAALQKWDLRWDVASVATSLAVFWGEEITKIGRSAGYEDEFAAPKLPGDEALKALLTASDKLTADFGSWQVPWGTINRFQRLNGEIVQRFDDARPSTPVGFTSSTWGSLAAFGARPYSAEETGRATGTKKWYGTGGNSFVAVVEFGDKVRARAVTAGGESGHPTSRHFNDQAERYCTGNLREVYFYREQLKGHTEREYHPGAP